MRTFLPQVLRTTLAGVVAGVIAVGAVVAVSAADGLPFVGDDPPSTDVSVPGGADTVPGDSVAPPGGDDGAGNPTLDDLQKQIDDLSASVADLVQNDAAQDTRLEKNAAALAEAADAVSALTGRLDRQGDSLKELRTAVQDLTAAVDTVVEDIAGLKARTVKLSPEGNYSGPVDPSQFSRRITPNDINGNWPLGRTVDKLDIDKLSPPRSGCWSDYRYNTVVALDVFGQYTCLRILK